MSLSEALLLDSHPTDVWVALRTDGVSGSGTESDPYEGSVKPAKPELSFTSITHVGNEDTAAVTSHGYSNGTNGRWNTPSAVIDSENEEKPFAWVTRS